MEAVAEAAQRAAERAEAGNPGRADEALNRVVERLETLSDRLSSARGDFPDTTENALERRFEQARGRTDQAVGAAKL